MRNAKHSLILLRKSVLSVVVLLSFCLSASAHRIETFTTNGCTSGQTLTIDAIAVFAPSNTWYAWQYKDNSGVWKCFTASNTINGSVFTASNFATTGPANNAPTISISAANSALENVLVRCIMRENASPCIAPTGTTWGGDDLSLGETKYLRLHIYTAIGDCGGTTPGCIGNVLTNSQGYYGGFENKTYDVAADSYTDNNFISGAGQTEFTGGTGAAHYQILNNPYVMNSSFARNIAPHSGNFQMVVQGNTTVASKVWYKTVAVTAGVSYKFSVWAARVDASDPSISLRVNGVEISKTSLATTAIGNWVEISGFYTAPVGTSSVVISIGDANAASGANNYTLDDICFRLMGSIGNLVFNDLNKNGLHESNEPGLGNVSVSLRDANGKTISSTLTDAAGNYTFRNLNTNVSGIAYTVVFGLPAGYVFTTKGATVSVDDNSDATPVTGVTGTVTLTSSVPAVNYVDAGMYYTSQSIIGDRVWNDLNKDGVQNTNEPGLSGITVQLYTSAGVLTATTVTSNNGYYSFSDLPANNYYLKVTPPAGYTVAAKNSASGTGATDNDFAPADFKTSVFTVTATTNNLDLDAGLFVNTVRSSIGDRVFNDLNNDGKQTAGEPGVSGVTVDLYNKLSGTLLQSRVTDQFGYYNFNALAAGSYYLKFTLPTGYTFATANVGTDETIDSDVDNANGAGTTATIALHDNEIRTIYDAGIKFSTSGLTSIGDTVWFDQNKDGLYTAGEPGMPGITVTLFSAANVQLQNTSTDKMGFYKFTNLTVGTSYFVAFGNIPSGYAFTSQDQGANDAIDSDVNPFSGRTGSITATAAGITNVDAGLIQKASTFPSKGSIGDFVWNDIDNDGLQNDAATGVEGITVKLYDATTNTVVSTVITDAFGKYLFTDVKGGIYFVEFSNLPSGYVFGTQTVGADKTNDSDPNATTGRTAAFKLQPGEINTSIDAAIRNASTGLSSLGDRVWNDVNGNGLLDAGEPGVAGVSVYLYDLSMNLLDNTSTNAKGYYLFSDLKGGSFIIGFGNLPAGFTATTKNVGGTAVADNDSDPNQTTLLTDAITLASNTNDSKWDFGIRSSSVGSIGDKVFNDLDRDGIQDANEPGVGGILVTLYNGATVIGSTVTDGSGNYIFRNVAASTTYQVGFGTLPGNSGFTTKNTTLGGATAATDSDVDPATGKTSVFSFSGGQNKTDVDAGLISLFASVGDYVWRDVNADGLQNATERGYAGMTVTLYNSATNTPITSAVSDGRGFYFINNIPVAATGSSFYMVLTGLLPNSTITTRYAGGSSINSTNNNDFSSVAGVLRTDVFTLNAGDNNPNIDAGIIAPDPDIVAITGLTLAATLNNTTTNLRWATEIEIDNDYFEIERSTDGTHFSSIGTRRSNGNTTARTEYVSADQLGALSNSTVVYYRIKSFDRSGEFIYSNIVSVRPSKSTSMEVWPNPFIESIKVKFVSASASKVSLRITDSKGTVIRATEISAVNGANQIDFNGLNNLAKGTYIINLIQDGQNVFSKMIIKN